MEETPLDDFIGYIAQNKSKTVILLKERIVVSVHDRFNVLKAHDKGLNVRDIIEFSHYKAENVLDKVKTAFVQFQEQYPDIRGKRFQIAVNTSVIKNGRPQTVHITLTKIVDNQNLVVITIGEENILFDKDKFSILDIEQHRTYTHTNHNTWLPDKTNLTDREQYIVNMSFKGKCSQEIADELHIKKCTIDYHKKTIMEKMGVEKFAEAIDMYFNITWPEIY